MLLNFWASLWARGMQISALSYSFFYLFLLNYKILEEKGVCSEKEFSDGSRECGWRGMLGGG